MATINDLPPETIHKILNECGKFQGWYWSFMEQCSVALPLIRCRGVCRLWNDVITTRLSGEVSRYKYYVVQIENGDVCKNELKSEENWEIPIEDVMGFYGMR